MTKNSRWINLGFQLAALVMALFITTLILLAAGAPPLEAYKNIILGSVSSFKKFSDVLVTWVPLLLASAGLLITFSAGLWNIGMEGQIMFGAIGTTWALRLMQDSGLPSALILVLDSVILIWPVSWLVNRLRRRGRGQPWPARLAPWVAAVTGIVAGVFLEGLVAVTLLGERTVLLFGLPSSAGWLLWLPPTAAALTVALVGLAVAAWRRGWWGTPRRVYFSILALAAVGTVTSFAVIGALWK